MCRVWRSNFSMNRLILPKKSIIHNLHVVLLALTFFVCHQFWISLPACHRFAFASIRSIHCCTANNLIWTNFLRLKLFTLSNMKFTLIKRGMSFAKIRLHCKVLHKWVVWDDAYSTSRLNGCGCLRFYVNCKIIDWAKIWKIERFSDQTMQRSSSGQ